MQEDGRVIFAEGYAAVVDGEIAVHTVSPTPRGAKVNAMVTLFGFMVMDHHTDEEINAAWAEVERKGLAALVGVEVRTA